MPRARTRTGAFALKATETVLEQAEVLSEAWSVA
jgi:hypothetical protein